MEDEGYFSVFERKRDSSTQGSSRVGGGAWGGSIGCEGVEGGYD